MITLILNSLLALMLELTLNFSTGINTAFAQVVGTGPAESPVTTSGMLLRMGVMFVMVFMIFQVLVIKPQKKKVQDQAKLASDLRKGDQVITTGGILARVVNIEKDVVTLEIAAGVRVKFDPSGILRRIEPVVVPG